MFFDQPQAAFDNLARWLAPGGRFAFAVWGPLPDNSWLLHTRDVVAQAVDIPQADPDAPGPYRYADASKLIGLLAAAGFSELTVRDWRGRLPLGGGLPPSAAADFALSALSCFGELLAAAGEAAQNRAKLALKESYGQYVQDGVVQMDARVHIVCGTRG